MRIVSLVPSLTEMVCDFGLRDQLAGCTQFCVEPKGLHRTAAIVGGTKDPDLEKIRALAPTHVLVNEEENKPEHIAACQKIAPTYLSFPKGPRDVPALLRDTAAWLGAPQAIAAAEAAAKEIESALARLSPTSGKRFLYLIWREPYMVAATDTYISAMLELVGWHNAAPDTGNRYPTMTVPEMQAAQPEVLLLSSEPYPFRKRDMERLQGEWGPSSPAMRQVDGQMYSWYGTRLVKALPELSQLCR